MTLLETIIRYRNLGFGLSSLCSCGQLCGNVCQIVIEITVSITDEWGARTSALRGRSVSWILTSTRVSVASASAIYLASPRTSRRRDACDVCAPFYTIAKKLHVATARSKDQYANLTSAEFEVDHREFRK